MQDSVGYYETLIEYYLPGLDHKTLDDEEFAQKVAYLRYILKKAGTNEKV